MKKFVTVLGMLACASAFAQDVDVDGTNAVQVYANVTTVTYLKENDNKGLTPGEAWEGTRIFRQKDGSCIQVVHSNLKIVKVGNVERPQFKETKAQVECPKMATVN